MSKKLRIEDMRKIAKSRGGTCLSTEYVDNKTKLKWQCKEGHVWKARPDMVKNKGSWCPVCGSQKSASKRKLTIEEMQKIAVKRGGMCLSTEYVNSKTKLKWQCSEGHRWVATPHHIKRDEWCPICSRRKVADKQKLTIEDMQKLAEKKRGKCLSTEYINNHTKTKWQCEYEHMWWARPNDIKSGYWCPICGRRKAADKRKLTIDEMQKLARERGGKCLSEEYTNAHTKLKWQCKEGHVWGTKPNAIKTGHWCPVCSQNVSERICRKLFEIIFSEKFPKRKPKWLINNEGNLMELDGYSKGLGLAFEYHGPQHYKFIPFFHRDKKAFEKRKVDDELKQELCKCNNVVLIEIPHEVDYEEMSGYIINECKRKGLKVSKFAKTASYKLLDVYSSEKLKEMQDLAKYRGGKCLSIKYINSKTKLRWQCKEGHRWEATPGNIKRGQWCPNCYGNIKLTIEDMQKLAEKRGGACLSTVYKNNKTKLKWMCSEGHRWEARPDLVKNTGSWCPDCAGNIKKTIGDMQKLAKRRGGKCLSKKYVNVFTKLTWQCSEGHRWEAVPHSIERDHWCPYCAGVAKLNIKER